MEKRGFGCRSSLAALAGMSHSESLTPVEAEPEQTRVITINVDEDDDRESAR